MQPLRFSNGEDFFEMLVKIEEDSSSQSCGDAYVSARVASSGFTGHNDFWIQAEALRGFATALLKLDQSLKGQADLESISPNELSLSVKSVSSRGHLGQR